MLKQNLSLKLGQKLAPQQIQLMKLIQLHTLEFEEELEKELEENPALEKVVDQNETEDHQISQNETESFEDDGSEQISTDFNVDEYIFDDEPSYKSASSNYSADDEEFDNTSILTESQTLTDYLMEQIRMMNISGEDLKIASYIIGNIDNEGYLRRELKSLVDDLAFSLGIYTSEEHLLKLLCNYIQKLDPAGVGARDLRECLILQIKAKENLNEVQELALKILDKQFDQLSNKHYSKIMHKFNCEESVLKDALAEITQLNPRIGGNFETQTLVINQEVIPDFSISIVNNKPFALLNSKNAPSLRISEDYKNILSTYSNNKTSSEHKQAALFIKQKLDSAKWYIEAINQRQNTLLQTINAIIKIQENYFLTGEEKDLKPMILKDISEITQFDISTISRVIKSKYADTQNGIIYLKNLFSDSLKNDDGEDISTKEIKTNLHELVENENKKKPLTDDALVELLKEKGYNVARRTIAKYRYQMNIPVARLRKNL